MSVHLGNNGPLHTHTDLDTRVRALTHTDNDTGRHTRILRVYINAGTMDLAGDQLKVNIKLYYVDIDGFTKTLLGSRLENENLHCRIDLHLQYLRRVKVFISPNSAFCISFERNH